MLKRARVRNMSMVGCEKLVPAIITGKLPLVTAVQSASCIFTVLIGQQARVVWKYFHLAYIWANIGMRAFQCKSECRSRKSKR